MSAPTPPFPVGTPVHFTWKGSNRVGVIVDSATFNGRTRYGIKTPGGMVYDVWPNNEHVWVQESTIMSAPTPAPIYPQTVLLAIRDLKAALRDDDDDGETRAAAQELLDSLEAWK